MSPGNNNEGRRNRLAQNVDDGAPGQARIGRRRGDLVFGAPEVDILLGLLVKLALAPFRQPLAATSLISLLDF